MLTANDNVSLGPSQKPQADLCNFQAVAANHVRAIASGTLMLKCYVCMFELDCDTFAYFINSRHDMEEVVKASAQVGCTSAVDAVCSKLMCTQHRWKGGLGHRADAVMFA